MTLLARLERKFGRYTLRGPINYLIVAQAVLYVWNLFSRQMGHRDIHELTVLIPAEVLSGQVWRLLTFLIDPPYMHPLWAFFYFSLMYFFANTLEHHWGSFRLNLYIGIGWLATIAVALLLPRLLPPMWFAPFTNSYLYASLFFAFAMLYPDFELTLYFLLPVKVKWLALVALLMMVYGIYEGGWPQFWISLPTFVNFLLFFGTDFWHRARHWWRGQKFRQSVRAGSAARAAFVHECRVCGLTSQMSPQTQFRYCSKCDGQACYCPEHVANHEHISPPVKEQSGAA